MEEKKEVKVSLGTVICIVIIVVLLCVIAGMWYYFTQIKNNDSSNNIVLGGYINNANSSKNEIDILLTEDEYNKQYKNQTTDNSNVLSSSEIEKILAPDNSRFCIENIEKSGDEYIITAYLLEDNSRIISKTEYEKLNNGGEIEFRNEKWKKNNNSQLQMEDGIEIISGNKRLVIIYDENEKEGFLENIAGAASGELCDFSSNTIKFKVSKNILIGGELFTEFKFDNNGNIKAYNASGEEIKNYEGATFDEILNICKTRTGTYQELSAIVRDGKVAAIQFIED